MWEVVCSVFTVASRESIDCLAAFSGAGWPPLTASGLKDHDLACKTESLSTTSSSLTSRHILCLCRPTKRLYAECALQSWCQGWSEPKGSACAAGSGLGRAAFCPAASVLSRITSAPQPILFVFEINQKEIKSGLLSLLPISGPMHRVHAHACNVSACF